MSSRRILTQAFLRHHRILLQRPVARPAIVINKSCLIPTTGLFKAQCYSTDRVYKVLDFNDIQKLIKEGHQQDYVLLDVREPKEVEAGYIPTAKNVPLTQFAYAWSLSDKDFEDQYGFKKPNKDKRLITYCLKGIRSTSAVEYLSKLGYTNLDNYVGSYADYIEKTKGE